MEPRDSCSVQNDSSPDFSISSVGPRLEQLEPRLLLSGSNPVPQLTLPWRSGETFVVEDYDNKATPNDIGFNYFMGNAGAVGLHQGTATLDISMESRGSSGGSLSVAFDFPGSFVETPSAGMFHSLFGLTDTKVSQAGDGIEPPLPTKFPGYYLDSQDIFRDLGGYENRSVEMLQFDVRLESGQDVTLKVELKDENDVYVYTYRPVSSGDWTTISLSLPTDFTYSAGPAGVDFNWGEISTFALIVEYKNDDHNIHNPQSGEFLLDNIRLIDDDGLYPDYEAISDPITDSLRPEYYDAFLDQVRGLSFQYFRDFSSTGSDTGGIVQDRSTFADLMTVGGAGFQLSAYVVGAERGYISRSEAATRTKNILQVLRDRPMGPDRVGTIGNRGFFYHFLGIDGRRKQNFDFTDTPDDESKNTVEVSIIDTSLLLCGALTSAQYFNGNDTTEADIRNWAQEIYERVDWPFLLNEDSNQFYLGWKPNEDRFNDDGHGRFLIDDAYGEGQYSSRFDGEDELPATLDYYTDEALLVALLAIASPTHPVPAGTWDGLTRNFDGGTFAKTYPGALFTYQFGSVWLDTKALGTDNGTPPIDYFQNTQAATEATRQYTIDNPLDRATWQDGCGEWLWGLSASEGPFDQYFAHTVPPAALSEGRPIPRQGYEAEDGTGDGAGRWQGKASGDRTVLLHAGDSRDLTIEVDSEVTASFVVRYSNDNYDDAPLETVDVTVDGILVGSFQAEDTGGGGFGWNVFKSSGIVGQANLAAGSYTVGLSVSGGDGGGVEVDKLDLLLDETGTVTAYGVAGAIPHIPDVGIESLWRISRQDLNADGSFELLNPRFGFVDAFNFDISAAAIFASPDAIRTSGPWMNPTGFSIDHGPMLLLIDNYLGDTYDSLAGEMFIPGLFMSNPDISNALITVFPDWRPSDVVDRHVFYNNSVWDGNDPAAGPSDDTAIAADKIVLLPGGVVSFANYSSGSSGVNGIMIDIANMPGEPVIGDFGFRVSDPVVQGGWSPGPAPSVTIRPGDGVGDSDRVTLVWPDGAITNKWVEVRVLGTGNTGLPADDVFYFANVVGDCDGDGEVGTSDYDVLFAQFGQRGEGLAADFNGDATVDIEDLSILQASDGSILAELPVLPGDADGNGVVDSGDFDILIGQFGLRGRGLVGDFDGDGQVGLTDFAIARGDLGNTLLPADPVGQTVRFAVIGDYGSGSTDEADVTGLAMSNAIAAENNTAGTSVGTLSTIDPDPGDTRACAPMVPVISQPLDLLMQSPSAAGYISEPQAISIGSSATTLQRAVTGEYDLRPLGDDLVAGQADDLLADILAESALEVPL
jgi:hypothetical protein